MGEDWHHKKEKQYRHQIQREAMTLNQTPLFDLPEEVEKQYMGQLDKDVADIRSGQILTLFVSGMKARPALIAGTVVVGHMDGDSAADVIRTLRSATTTATWPVMAQLRVIEMMESTDHVILSPIKHKKGRR